MRQGSGKLRQHRTNASSDCVGTSFVSFILPFRGQKFSRFAVPPFPTKPHSAAVSSFAALRMRHTPCGYFVGLWWGPLGLFSARNAFVKPCNTQSIPAVLHLFLTKNLSSDSLVDLCGIALKPFFEHRSRTGGGIVGNGFLRIAGLIVVVHQRSGVRLAGIILPEQLLRGHGGSAGLPGDGAL